MIEVYFIYDTVTGLCDGGVGRVDRSASPDGSTTVEMIKAILSKKETRDVAYFKNMGLPDPERWRVDVKTGELIER